MHLNTRSNPTLQIFVSYSFQDLTLGSTFASYIRQHVVGVAVDVAKSPATAASDVQGIWDRIVNAHLVVVLATERFLQGYTSIEEVVRADAFEVPILAICQSECYDAFLQRFPFIKRADVVKVSNALSFEDAAEEMAGRLRTKLADAALVDAHDVAREIRKTFVLASSPERYTPLSGSPQYVRDILRGIVSNMGNEVSAVRREAYDIDLSIERDFLLRGAALFGNAESVLAVSRDDVSRFWTHASSRDQVVEYIRRQSPHTQRLFVFSGPQSANAHRFVLEASDARYGRDGAVLVCSRTTYDQVLRDYASPGVRGELASKDFGLLCMPPQQGQSYTLLAQLDSRTLAFKHLEGATGTLYDWLGKVLKGATKQTGPGRNDALLHSCQYTIGKGRILRWYPGLAMNDEEWARALAWVFGETLAEQWQHVVLFNARGDGDAHFTDKLTHVRTAIEGALAGLNIPATVWVGRRQKLDVEDSTFKGKLITDRDRLRWGYALIVRFDSKADLEKWYGHPDHSRVRKDVYNQLSDSVGFIYEELERLRSEDIRRLGWSFIEQQMVEALWRLDFMEIEDYASIARRRPEPLPGQDVTEHGRARPTIPRVP